MLLLNSACVLLLPCLHIAAFPLNAKTVETPSLLDATIYDLVQMLESGQTTSVELVDAYVARIGEVNGILHAVTEVNPDA